MQVSTLERHVRQQGVEATTKRLVGLTLPKLRQYYEREVGDGNRSPNKKFLARKVAEAIKARLAAAPPPTEPAADGGLRVVPAARVDEMTPAQRADAYLRGELKPRHMDVESLQLAFAQAVGRPTDSVNAGYLVWKIRVAKRGTIKTGPVDRTQGAKAQSAVLPLRVQPDKVDPLNALAKAMGFGSRNRFLKAAVAFYAAGANPNGLPASLASWHPEDEAALPIRPPAAA